MFLAKNTSCAVAATAATVAMQGCKSTEDPPVMTVCNIFDSTNSCKNDAPSECEWIKQGDNICRNSDDILDYMTSNLELCEDFDGFIGNQCEESCSDVQLRQVTWADVTSSNGRVDNKTLVSFLIPSEKDKTIPHNANGYRRCSGHVEYDESEGTVQFDDIQGKCELPGGSNKISQTDKLTQEQFEAFLPLEADDVKSCRNKWCGVAIPMNGINPECIPAEHYCNPQGTTQSPQDLCDDQKEFTSDPLCKIISPATPDGIFCQPAVPPCSQATALNGGSDTPCKVPYKDSYNKNFTTKYCKPNPDKTQCSSAPLVQCTLQHNKQGCQAVVQIDDSVMAVENLDDYDFDKLCTLDTSDGECAVEKIEGTYY